jgi:hypothetical protein
MTGRILHSKAFLSDLRSVIERNAPILLTQPVARALTEAWKLSQKDDSNDYDPRLRNALGITAQIFDVDVGPLTSVSELPFSTEEVLSRIYQVGNVHSLAEYLNANTRLLFTNSNIEAIYLGPVSQDSVLISKLFRKKLLLTFSSEFSLNGSWFEFDYVAGPEQSEVVFTKEEFTDRGLEFYTDFARDSSDVSWIAFPQYRLALGKRVSVPPWIPLPHWR